MSYEDIAADDEIVEDDVVVESEPADEADARARRRLELSPVMTAAAVGGLSAAGIAVAVILGRRFLKRRQERSDD